MKDELFQELLKSIKEGGQILKGLDNLNNLSGLKKLSDEKRPCMFSDHNPPSHIVLSPGTYEHTCSHCGQKQIFTVRGIWK